ncbi:MAG: hypothetical protein AB1394_11200, partial [Bacteroidota bacterium]
MFQKFTKWLQTLPWINDTVLFLVVLALAFFSYIILRGIVFASIKRIVKKTSTQIDDILFSKTFLRRISYLAPLFIIYHSTGLIPGAEKELDKLLTILF